MPVSVTPNTTGTSAVPSFMTFVNSRFGGNPVTVQPGVPLTLISKTVAVASTGPDLLVSAAINGHGTNPGDNSGITLDINIGLFVDGVLVDNFQAASPHELVLNNTNYFAQSTSGQWVATGLAPGNHLIELKAFFAGVGSYTVQQASIAVTPFATADATFV